MYGHVPVHLSSIAPGTNLPWAMYSPSPHSAMCHFQVLTHTNCWVPFCHRVLADYGPPIAAARP
ncbi:unnamed protein product [Staurois parvus]|uniref:Uncharacterized protein n=1 Tax=Staurois parvus TaxID=386267 RepID=A0ABN9HD79_9NEOB|nr:unnamed protein product [Staurois parvus]